MTPPLEPDLAEETLSVTPKPAVAAATSEPDIPPPELNPPDDAEFVSEELPADFWDSEPIPYDENERINSSISANSFFDAPPDQPPPKLAPKAEKKSEPVTAEKSSPKPTASKPQAKGEGRFGTPMFGELESLFPGRVVKVEEHPQEDAEVLDAGDEEDQPDSD